MLALLIIMLVVSPTTHETQSPNIKALLETIQLRLLVEIPNIWIERLLSTFFTARYRSEPIRLGPASSSMAHDMDRIITASQPSPFTSS
jgi:hypothetical protein